jgi:hypothetical protein
LDAKFFKLQFFTNMKKMIVLGLCLATSVSVFSVKNTNANESNLGVATVVVGNNKMVAYEDIEAAATAKLATKVWNKSCKEIARAAAYAVADWLLGMDEASVASVELQDEINSKLKTL